MRRTTFILLLIIGLILIIIGLKKYNSTDFKGGYVYPIDYSEDNYNPDKSTKSAIKIGPQIKDTFDGQPINRFEYWHEKPSKIASDFFDFNAQVMEEELILDNKKIVKGRGYFHESEIRIETIKNGREGVAIIKPFQFVREKSNSVGGPVWFGFDAILVNVGWLPKGMNRHNFTKKTYLDLLDNPIEILGYNILLEESNSNAVIENKDYTLKVLWEIINEQISLTKKRPAGGRLINCYVELINEK